MSRKADDSLVELSLVRLASLDLSYSLVGPQVPDLERAIVPSTDEVQA